MKAFKLHNYHQKLNHQKQRVWPLCCRFGRANAGGVKIRGTYFVLPPRVLQVWGLWGGILLCSFMGVSCGLANYNFNESTNDNNPSFQNSSSQGRGTFESAGGRLSSQNTCSDNDNCVELCDSMLERLSLQKDCYAKTEEEVQALRDTYNLLALGNPRKLARVEPTEMEEFLEFDPMLYETAIQGFVRGKKENCTEVTAKEIRDNNRDPREREDCKLKNYYMQDGYSSVGSAEALEWIARNNWLAELLLKYDKEHGIMLALLDILANGGEYPIEDGDNSLIDDANEENTPKRDSVCVWGKAYNGTPPGHGRLINDKDKAPSDKRNQYQAFGADCIDMDKNENYFMIAIEEENEHSVKLGNEVLKDELCDGGATDCESQFCSKIKGGTCDLP